LDHAADHAVDGLKGETVVAAGLWGHHTAVYIVWILRFLFHRWISGVFNEPELGS